MWSAVQIDSKPASSADRASSHARSGSMFGPMLAKAIPNFVVSTELPFPWCVSSVRTGGTGAPPGFLVEVPAQLQVLDATVDRRVQPLGRRGELEPLEPGEQVPEERLELDPGQIGSHAEVGPGPEGQVVVR